MFLDEFLFSNLDESAPNLMETLIDQADSSAKSNHRFNHRSILAKYGLQGEIHGPLKGQ